MRGGLQKRKAIHLPNPSTTDLEPISQSYEHMDAGTAIYYAIVRTHECYITTMTIS